MPEERTKLSALSVLQVDGMERPIRKPRVTLPADILGEVFRHFSRKDLSQQIYLVNHQYYRVATSKSHVPSIHFIEKVSFAWTLRDKHGNRILWFYQCWDRLWEGYTRKQVGIPGPFVRFLSLKLEGQAFLKCQGPAILRFLRDTKESFVGCNLSISFKDCSKYSGVTELTENYISSRACNLLQNVFHSPFSVTVCGAIWMEKFIKTTASSNCRRLELRYDCKIAPCTRTTSEALLDWLKIGTEQLNDGHREQSVQKKHLVLEHYRRICIVKMIDQIKDDFEHLPPHNAEFVITFLKDKKFSLDKTFSLDNISTGERLSFFKYNPPNSKTRYGAYRLWHRSVTCEAADSAKLSFLQNGEELQGNVESDQNIFSFEFPLCNNK
ncbi:hypothetical protein DdX_12946 [Ditylenchus destructor]|uniref:F-box domain-containing protein n=1 Tax=Ditylenchus destructor TaxID=166010 RepID=A0AAD4MZN2_9BILA|nr:hypothetical protein DdX_12946 [Ditylenchus destructor]